MDVTIIIISWNSQQILKKCLQHVFAQTVQPHRIIVVDNNSSDKSASIAEEFESIDVRRMAINLGFAAGNNQALDECKTEWVALLNPDAFPAPNWLESLMTAATDNPDIAVFGSRQLCFDNPLIIDGIGDIYHMSGIVWREHHRVPQQADDLIAKEIFSPCAAAALYKRQVINEMGGFDEDFFCYMEDVDLGFRLRLAGYKSLYVPEAAVYHVGSATTGGHHSDFSVYHGHRNLVWTFIKNMPGALFWLLFPLHLMLNIFSIIWFSAKGQRDAIIRAKWDALKGVPAMWRKRKEIQTNRRASVLDIWHVLDKRVFPRRKS